MNRLVFLPVWLVALASGCTVVRSHVSVFHDLPPTPQPLKYAALRLKGQEGSLEHASYEELVKVELNKRGWIETAAADADVVLFLDYGIDSGRQVQSSYPIIGQTGTSSSHTTGSITTYGRYATYSGTTYHTPTYGVVGTGTRTKTVFTRFLRMDLVDRRELAEGRVKKRLEARLVSAGSSGQVAAVMPEMIQALFSEFPGKSGSTRRVDIPAQ